MAAGVEWFDAEAATRYLGIFRTPLYRLVHAGQLEAVSYPVRFRHHDLDACIERCRIKPGDLACRTSTPA